MGSTSVPSDLRVRASEVFVLLFVTLGPPLKVRALFLSTTRHLDEDAAKALASRAFLFAVAAAKIGGFIGVSLMQRWHVSDAALRLAGGIVFFLVSLRSVVGEYDKGGLGHTAAGSERPHAHRIRERRAHAGHAVRLGRHHPVDRAQSGYDASGFVMRRGLVVMA